jgi:predicted butyrate kinase (DUF1464 family)
MDNLEELAKRLITLPDEINKSQNLIVSLIEDVKAKQGELDKVEAGIRTEISEETDGNGKKLYTNAESREAAFIQVSSDNSEYLELKNDIILINKVVNTEKNKVEMLSNEQRNTRALLYFFGGGERQ